MHDTAGTVRDWLSSGQRVAFARVINRVGFSGATERELLACNEQGDTTGDLLAGTVVDPSIAALRRTLEAGSRGTTVLSAQIDDAQAVGAGLSGAGWAQVVLHPPSAVPAELWSALAEQRAVVLATGMDGAVAAGDSLVV